MATTSLFIIPCGYGTDVYTVKRLLGHRSLKTTLLYLHLLPERITLTKSPLDYLFEESEGSDENR